MKNVIGSLMAVLLITGMMVLVGSPTGPGACIAGELSPVVAVGTPLVKLDKKAMVVIMGTGFKPGQEINIVFVTADGVKSDIGYALKPVPKPDKTGSWATSWGAGRFVSKKLVKMGAYKLMIFDGEYNAMAQTAVYFSE